jgi:4-aminobutyrate aminotransferase / (S)-3-amino-2-methylpropionate transaminase / 5-aminovalerate transaminase
VHGTQCEFVLREDGTDGDDGDMIAQWLPSRLCIYAIWLARVRPYRRRQQTQQEDPLTTITPGGPAIAQERRLVTSVPGPRSQQIQARKSAAVARGVGTTLPVYVVAAGGGVVVDADGNSLIDFGSGIAVTTVGNSAPAVVAAVTEQVQAFTHTCFMVTPYDGYVRVAEALNGITPGRHEKRTVLFNSGAEAVENAVKIARAHTNRQAVVVFDHAYHGRTNLTMAMTAKNQPYKHGFGPFASEIYRVPTSFPFRDGDIDGPAAARRAIDIIDKQVGAENVAAVVIEPIHGEGGFIVPAPGFLPALVDWCRDNGVVFVADEVQTGFARTGAMFACEHEGVVPDLIATAKGIAGGLPLSAVTGRAEIMDAPHVGGLGGTYGGNPLACAAALAVIETIEDDGLLDRAREIGKVMIERLTAIQARDPRIGDVRGRGAMIAVELVKPGAGEPDADLTKRIASTAHGHGLIVLTCGTHGNVLRFLPPLSIPDHLLHEGLDVLDAAFKETR